MMTETATLPPAIVWFRRNLRLTDNLALTAAAESGQPILPVYIIDELDSGAAIRWWLHHSLLSLDSSLRQYGSSLRIFEGEPASILANLAKETGAVTLHYGRRFEPAARLQERVVEKEIGRDIDIFPCDDAYLGKPEAILTKGGTPFKVFTPFWNAASEYDEIPPPRPVPENLCFTSRQPQSLTLAALALRPQNPDWASKFHDAWTPGEHGALQRLDQLNETIENYGTARDRPDLDSTSRLSPHLHFGEISPRQVAAGIELARRDAEVSAGASALLRQLYWRDFSAYLLFHNPTLPHAPLRPEFRHFPWSASESDLAAWQRGMTGYPVVDAGMRQLWATGWMHNRVRMIVASFLVKHLLVPWQYGADWFLDTLVDADLANNSASWQWVAGCGTDSAPYFRIFNPILQGKKFDPNGHYVKRWLPELKNLPTKHVHEPWKTPIDTQKSIGVLIGEDYPEPVVDHADARQDALAAYQLMRQEQTEERHV